MRKLLLLALCANEEKEYEDIELSNLKISPSELLALEPLASTGWAFITWGKKIKRFPLKYFKFPIFTLMHKQPVFYLKIFGRRALNSSINLSEIIILNYLLL